MAQVLSLCAPAQASPVQPHRISSSTQPSSTRCQLTSSTQSSLVSHRWVSLQQSLKCKGSFSCLFSDNNKQEQAKKALESALGGKKIEFEKWDKEIKKREESGGGGGGSGGGGWFGWGRWFGESDGDRFWQEAQQTSLTILGILVIYLIIAKGDVILAVIVNPLLYALRGTRNGLAFVSSQVMKVVNPNSHSSFSSIPHVEVPSQVSAKESVARKWGSD